MAPKRAVSLEESCVTLHHAAGDADDSPLQAQQVAAALRHLPMLLPAEDGRRRRPPAGRP
jgi:hypothetical protein